MDDFEDIYTNEIPSEEAIANAAAESAPDKEDKTENKEGIVSELRESNSIYDFGTLTESSEKQPEISANYTFSTSDKKLSYIGNDSQSLPTEVIYSFGLKTLILDISFNLISDLRDLHQFPHLEELICDNNEISEHTEFPKLESLKILSCNKNKINDIHVFIDKVKIQFPNLTYLSLLGNQACPNQLIDPNKDDYDYSRYRKYVLFRMRKLKFLDCYEVTKEERRLIAEDSLFLDVVTPDETNIESSLKREQRKEKTPNDNYTPLPQLDSEKQEAKGSFGYCRYVYYGKQSEGNRFIRNDDL